MSILIEGIDLPENRNGSIKIRIYGSGRVWADKTLVGQATQIDRPHGRLVDADDIKAKCINEVFEGMGTVAITDPYPDDEWADDICDVPTILEEEK